MYFADSPKTPADNTDFYNLCSALVNYQQNFYDGDPLNYNTEGFVIGSPWHGDPLNAAILFLAQIPASRKAVCSRAGMMTAEQAISLLEA